MGAQPGWTKVIRERAEEGGGESGGRQEEEGGKQGKEAGCGKNLKEKKSFLGWGHRGVDRWLVDL